MNSVANRQTISTTIHDAQWETPFVSYVAEIDPQILLGWRRRLGFLGGPKPGSQGLGGYKHSLIDIFVATTIASMIRRGLNPEDAIGAEQKLANAFTDIATGKIDTTIFAYRPKGRDAKAKVSFSFFRPDHAFGELFGAARGVDGFMVVNLQAIIDHCTKSLKNTAIPHQLRSVIIDSIRANKRHNRSDRP